MKFCMQCGNELAPADSFCAECGTPVSTTQAGPASRGRVRYLLVAAGVLGLLVVGVAVVSALTGGAQGGASSPEELAKELATAVSSEDPLAAARLVDPDEIEGLPGLVERFRDSAREGGGVSDGGGVKGLDASVDGLKVDVEELGEGVARVDLSAGRVSVLSNNPLGGAVRSRRSDGVDLSQERFEGSSDTGPYFFVARKHDGKWFVSLALTAGEYAVRSSGAPPGDYSELEATDKGGRGGRSPSDSGRRLGQVVSNRDVTGFISLLPAEQRKVARVYRAAIDEAISGPDGYLNVNISGVRAEEKDLGGGKVRLDLRDASMDASASSGTANLRLRGSCVGKAGNPQCFSIFMKRFFGLDSFFVVARKEDGRYQLDPLGTAAEYLKRRLERFTVSDYLTLTGQTYAAKPSGTLHLGSSLDGEYQQSGSAVVAFRGKQGPVAFRGNSPVQVYERDGTSVNSLGYEGREQVFLLPRDEEYRLVLYRGDTERFKVTGEQLREGDLEEGRSFSGTLGKTGVAVLSRPYSEEIPFSTYRYTGSGPSLEMVELGDDDAVNLEPDSTGLFFYTERPISDEYLRSYSDSRADDLDREDTVITADYDTPGRLYAVLRGKPGGRISGKLEAEVDDSEYGE